MMKINNKEKPHPHIHTHTLAYIRNSDVYAWCGVYALWKSKRARGRETENGIEKGNKIHKLNTIWHSSTLGRRILIHIYSV